MVKTADGAGRWEHAAMGDRWLCNFLKTPYRLKYCHLSSQLRPLEAYVEEHRAGNEGLYNVKADRANG